MTIVALGLLALPVASLVYAYLVYPAALWCAGHVVRRQAAGVGA